MLLFLQGRIIIECQQYWMIRRIEERDEETASPRLQQRAMAAAAALVSMA